MTGLEGEYALTAFAKDGARVGQDAALSGFMTTAARVLPHLPTEGQRGLFLQNGARLYLDCGKPEITTPEVVTPTDACRYVLAGEAILSDVGRALVAENRAIETVFITRCNVGYSTARNTWANHESIGYEGDPHRLPKNLIPHLVSRVIYTGAGGFNNRSSGLEFMLSPRVAHLEQVISSDSTGNRGIYHTKDEPLSHRRYHRLHILCGDALCSETSLWLKMATTALVVAMVEAGLNPGAEVQLHAPLDAMRQFAADVNCSRRVPAQGGRHLCALDIQRHYLQLARDHADHPGMPPWAPNACEKWSEILQRLEQGPPAVAKTVDWAIKLALYVRFARRSGIAWESLADWDQAIVTLSVALQHAYPAEPGPPLTMDALRQNGDIAAEVTRQAQWLKRKGLAWEQLEDVLALRQQLFELDTRFGDLSDDGIFTAMNRAGVLDHHLEDVTDIEGAKTTPPAVGRARLRGECVRRFQRTRGDFACSWTGVVDQRNQRFLDLSDPFATDEQWRDIQVDEPQRGPPDPESFRVYIEGLQAGRQPPRRRRQPQRTMLSEGFQAYDRGDYEQAYNLLQEYGRVSEWRRDPQYRRLTAWVQTRRGFVDGAESLIILPANRPVVGWLINDYLCVYRFQGLAPRPEMADWLRQGEAVFDDQRDRQPPQNLAFNEHKGYWLLYQGRLHEAKTTLEQVCDPPADSPGGDRVHCRALATLGEVYRRMGHPRKARAALNKARAEQRRASYKGDLADVTLTHLAKLESRASRALALLEEVAITQTALCNRMGEARTLLLKARLCNESQAQGAIQTRLLELRDSRPALAQCPLFNKVLDRWGSWTGSCHEPDQTGDIYWGV